MKFNKIGKCCYQSENKEFLISKDYSGWAIFRKQPNSPISFDGSYNYLRCVEHPSFSRLKDCMAYFKK